MRLWIDCEFNSYKGRLMSLALVGEGDVQFYVVLPMPDEIDPWVQTNVVPILGAKPTPYRDAQDELETFLAAFESVHIVADWPEDIAHFCDFLITGPGQRIDTPPLTMEVVRVDAPSKVPHNALWDAIGIRDFMLADAALSHAAGQEAVAYRIHTPFSGPLNWIDGAPSEYTRKYVREQGYRLQISYDAPPTTSAEVGRDAARYRWLREEAGRDKRGSDHDRLHVSINYPTKMADGSGYTGLLVTPRGKEFDARVDAAMAASSGRHAD